MATEKNVCHQSSINIKKLENIFIGLVPDEGLTVTQEKLRFV
jgi:hypothetical protein